MAWCSNTEWQRSQLKVKIFFVTQPPKQRYFVAIAESMAEYWIFQFYVLGILNINHWKKREMNINRNMAIAKQ